MMSPDVNVLLYAHRSDLEPHEAYADWLRSMAQATEPFALSEIVLSAFLRIATSRRVFRDPTPLDRALEFVEELRSRDNCRLVRPGERHWAIFTDLCRAVRARDKLVADAYHAAVAIEHGCEWVSADGDFARFKALRWRHPLATRA